MATITLPASPGFSSVSGQRIKASELSVSPYTFGQQVQNYPGKIYMFTFNLPAMSKANGHAWLKFLDDLEGYKNTFNYNVNEITLGDTHGPGTIALRLATPSFNWDITTAMHFGLTFEAMEAISL
jgi:hypothetical protein